MRELNSQAVIAKLVKIVEFELAGAVRYTNYALVITGPYRATIIQFLQEQANESLTHAQQAGEVLTGLGGSPSFKIAPIEELPPSSPEGSIHAILTASLQHEERAIELYKGLLHEVEDASIYLEEYTRGMIGQEELHVVELRKMLRDFSL